MRCCLQPRLTLRCCRQMAGRISLTPMVSGAQPQLPTPRRRHCQQRRDRVRSVSSKRGLEFTPLIIPEELFLNVIEIHLGRRNTKRCSLLLHKSHDAVKA